MRSSFIFLTLGSLAFAVGCAHGDCRQVEHAKSHEPVPAAAALPGIPGEAVAAKSPSAPPRPQAKQPGPVGSSPARGSQARAVEPSAIIYKYDGSLQCGMGRGLTVEEMERELSGIKVHSRLKKPDGLMHIQVCGQPTGLVNTYEIPQKNLADAEERGFRKWDLD